MKELLNFLKQSGILNEVAQQLFQLQQAVSGQEPTTIKQVFEEPTMTLDEACDFCKISRVTLYNWRKQGLVKVYGMGRRKYLFKSELIESLKQPKKYASRSVRGLSQVDITKHIG